MPPKRKRPAAGGSQESIPPVSQGIINDASGSQSSELVVYEPGKFLLIYFHCGFIVFHILTDSRCVGCPCLDEEPVEVMIQDFDYRVVSCHTIMDKEWDIFACFLRRHMKGEPFWLGRKLGGYVLHGLMLKSCFEQLKSLIQQYVQGMCYCCSFSLYEYVYNL